MIELNFPNPIFSEKDDQGRRIFFGRQSERERIERTLSSGVRRPVIVLGERRSGKTSLQRVSTSSLEAQRPGHFCPLFIEPQGIRSRDQLAQQILERLCSLLGTSLRQAGLAETTDSVGQFVDAVVHLIGPQDGQGVLVCVDEFETILTSSPQPEQDKILGLITHIIEQTDLPLTFFLTMTGLTKSIQESYRSSFAAVAEIIRLEPFDLETTQDMVTGLLQGQVDFPPALVAHLFRLSGGYPYFSKLLLANLLERYPPRGKEPLTVSEDMLKQTVRDAAHDPRADIAVKNIYQVHFDDLEKRIVLLLAGRGEGGRLTLEELDIMGVSLKTAARRLAQRCYLKGHDDGSFGFHVTFLGHWLRSWIEFEEEQERLELEALWQDLGRQKDPWADTEATVLTAKDMRRFGLRPRTET